MNLSKTIFPAVLYSLFSLWLVSCQTTAPAAGEAAPGTAATAQDSTATAYVRLSPDRVDIRGFITQREYNQGQMLILVEGNMDQNSRFNRAVVLVTPITQIIGPDGRSRSLSELTNGQFVSVLFRGRYREGVGFSAQATARKLWIEPWEEQ